MPQINQPPPRYLQAQQVEDDSPTPRMAAPHGPGADTSWSVAFAFQGIRKVPIFSIPDPSPRICDPATDLP